MRRSILRVGIAVGAAMLPLIALAQAPQAPPGGDAGQAQADAARARYQLSLMERVLEVAAQHGAQQTTQKLRSSLPDSTIWIEEAIRARGFRLDNYGCFFDLEMPSIRGSVMVAMDVLDRNQAQFQSQLVDGFDSLRSQVAMLVSDSRVRSQLEAQVRRIQEQVVGPGDRPAVGPPPAAASAPRPPDILETYRSEVKNALMQAMVDDGSRLGLGPDEWLTVAARTSDPGSVGTDSDRSRILRIKGSDLIALKTGKISREEALKRIEVREF